MQHYDNRPASARRARPSESTVITTAGRVLRIPPPRVGWRSTTRCRRNGSELSWITAPAASLGDPPLRPAGSQSVGESRLLPILHFRRQLRIRFDGQRSLIERASANSERSKGPPATIPNPEVAVECRNDGDAPKAAVNTPRVSCHARVEVSP
jgi:hypothetical protein